MGYWPLARGRYSLQTARTKEVQVGHLLLRSFALLGHSQVLADLGRLEEGLRMAEEAQRIATTISWPRFVASAEGTKGYIHFLNGALERAEEDLLSAVTQLSSIRQRMQQTIIHFWWRLVVSSVSCKEGPTCKT